MRVAPQTILVLLLASGTAAAISLGEPLLLLVGTVALLSLVLLLPDGRWI
jgi:hypothetical protein